MYTQSYFVIRFVLFASQNEIDIVVFMIFCFIFRMHHRNAIFIRFSFFTRMFDLKKKA